MPTRTFTLYTLKYTDRLAKMFQDPDSIFLSYEFNARDYAIVSQEEVPYKFEFISSFMGEHDFNVFPRTAEIGRIHFRSMADPYEAGRWNYTAEEYARHITANVNHVWMRNGEPLPEDIFAVFQKTHPTAINGRV